MKSSKHKYAPKSETTRRGEYKCRILKMHLKLRDEQLKTILYIYVDWQVKTMVTLNQKGYLQQIKKTHTHTKKGNQSTTLKIVIKSEENGKKKPPKKIQNN